MDVNLKKEQLNSIYERFESAAAPYRNGAICRAGCAFCCSHAGSIDITTLEGLVIQDRLKHLLKPSQKQVLKQLKRNRKNQEQQRGGRCPFLRTNQTCMIYDVRPFSCRRVYSVEPCEGKGPTLHRQVMDLAQQAIGEIQRLDDTGYSGHLSYILYMLEAEQFRKTYLAGDFDPGAVMVFGKSHKIVINRYMSGAG